MNISNVITCIISISALGLASYSLYLQRKDKKPRLKLHIETDKQNVYLGKKNEMGFSVEELVEVLIIHAANPTDKQINVETIHFKAEKYPSIAVPLIEGIENIPSGEKRQAKVVVVKLRAELGVARLGQFIIVDALGNKHKSEPVWV
jgi:hypothetical protein